MNYNDINNLSIVYITQMVLFIIFGMISVFTIYYCFPFVVENKSKIESFIWINMGGFWILWFICDNLIEKDKKEYLKS